MAGLGQRVHFFLSADEKPWILYWRQLEQPLINGWKPIGLGFRPQSMGEKFPSLNARDARSGRGKPTDPDKHFTV
jgi:hypothetical protein